MFWKLVVTILVLGFAACLLLVDRQKRLDLAAEMSRTHERMREHERSLWRLQTDIAFRTRPAMIRDAADRLGVEWEPIHDRLAMSRASSESRAATVDDGDESSPETSR